MKIRARVFKDNISFGSPLARMRFFEKFKGKDILIEPDDAPTAEKRRYFEGCLVPVVFYTHPNSDWKSFADAREAIKSEFLGRPVKAINGDTVLVSRSTTELSNEKFGQFLEAVVHWIRENQLAPEEALDPDNYKEWRDSALSPDAVYPPLARLKGLYNKAHGELERGEGEVS